jgi:Ca-activated chloride channel family protein
MMQFAYPHHCWWLLAVVALLALAVRTLLRKYQGWRAFQVHGAASRLFGEPSWTSALLRIGLRCGAGVLLGVALLGPCWGEQCFPAPPQPSRDVLVLLDVSRSMLAEDVAPNRLEMARAGLRQLAAALEHRGGYRIGLLAFADRAVVLCPLTPDYRHFHQELADASLEGIRLRQASRVQRDGTQITEALQRALQLCSPAVEDSGQAPSLAFCDTVLISDGSNGDPGTEAAARSLAQYGLAVHTVGVGDSTQDSPIPVTLPTGQRDYLRYHGAQVGTRLEETLLREVAEATGGTYLAAGTGPFPVEQLLGQLASNEARQLTTPGEVIEPIHRYSWFLLPAIVLLFLENLVKERLRPSKHQGADCLARPRWLVRLVPPARPRRTSWPAPRPEPR